MPKSLVHLTLLATMLLTACDLPSQANPAQMSHGLPWQVDSKDNQVRVFDITLGKSSLNDAVKQFGDNHQLALMLNAEDKNKQEGNLELYFPSLHFGPISGKVIFVAELDGQDKNYLLERTNKIKQLESGVKKISLQAEHVSTALSHAIIAITFIPTAQLNSSLVFKHFGPSPQILKLSETVTAYIYPSLSLHIIINSKGKDFIEYSLAEDFEPIKMQLLKQSAEK